MTELMCKIITVSAVQGLEFHRERFLFSMKARLIQNTYKKHRVIIQYYNIIIQINKICNLFTTRKKLLLKQMIQEYRTRKRIKKILFWFIRLRLKRKLMIGLVLLRTKIIK